jgi:quercetin dioxygenase-like cupin family protein
MEHQEMINIDTNTTPWQERFQEALGKAMFLKPLLQDPDTGMMIRMVRYPAGFMNKWHDHPCAHGMFVLEGTLVTHAGVHGPGSFVWFPEGMQMEHGATEENDVVALFITNKLFEIRYMEKKV